MSKFSSQAVDVYLEKHKTRIYVGKLSKEGKYFVFTYNEAYRRGNHPVPLGPDLPLKKQTHRALALFPSLADKIPSKKNPAYKEYCQMAGISPLETNPFVLLAALGKKGPSSFVCVPVSKNTPFTAEDLKHFRKSLKLSLREFARVFDVSTASLYRVENKKTSGKNILKKIADYRHSPRLLKSKLQQTGSKIHEDKKTFIEKALKSPKPLSQTGGEGVFTLTPDDLKQCTPLQATELLRRLMLMECQSFGIPQNSVHVSRQISTPDGGQDGLVKWPTGRVQYTNYFPKPYNVFQIKASSLPPARCIREVFTDSNQLKPALKKALKHKGAYIVCSTHPVSGVHAGAREEALYQALKKQGEDFHHLEIRFYDANILTNWINLFPSLVVWFLKEVCQKSLKPWLSYEEWSRGDGSYKQKFMYHNELKQKKDLIYNTLSERGRGLCLTGASGVGKTRLALEAFRPQPADQEDLSPLVLYADMGEEPLTTQNIKDLKNHRLILIIDNCPLEKAEVFHQTASQEDSQISLLTIDADSELSQGDRLTKAPHTPLMELKPDRLIVQKMLAGCQDITNKHFHPKWLECAQGFPLMVQLLKSTGPLDLLNQPRPFLTNKMLGRQIPPGAYKVLKACSLFHNICFEDEEQEQMRIIIQHPPARTGQEAHYVAEQICGMSFDNFFKNIQFLKKRKIIGQFGRFIQVRPKPLSTWLARELMGETPSPTLIKWITNRTKQTSAPLFKKERREFQKRYNQLSYTEKKEFQREQVTHSPLNPLRQAFAKQLAYLKNSPESHKLVKRLLNKDGPFGSKEVLTTGWGAGCLTHLAKLHPPEALNTLKRIFEDMPLKELKTVQHARFLLTGILQELAFRKELYSDSAHLLLRFAETETEDFFDNNATGIFAHHFQIYLSGTEAPPSLKLQVIRDIQKQGSDRQKETALKALQSALKTKNFTGIIGRGRGEQGWQPETYGEIWDYYCQALGLLKNFVIKESNTSLQNQAKNTIAQNLMPLLTLRTHQTPPPAPQTSHTLRSEKLYQCIKQTIEDITSKTPTPLVQAFQQMERFLNRHGGRLTPDLKSKLTTLLQTLKPRDITCRLRSYVTQGNYHDIIHPQYRWGSSAPPPRGKTKSGKGKPGTAGQKKYTSGFLSLVEEFSSLLKQQIKKGKLTCLKVLFHGPGNNTFPFAGEVARQLKPNKQMMDQLLKYTKNHKNDPDFNSAFLTGFITGLQNNNLRDRVLDYMAGDKNMAGFLAAIYNHLNLRDRDIKRLTSVLKKNTPIPPGQLPSIGYTKNCKNVSPPTMARLFEELAGQKSPPLAWAGLYIYHYYQEDLPLKDKQTLLPALYLLLTTPGLLTIQPRPDPMAGVCYKQALGDILNSTTHTAYGKQITKTFLNEVFSTFLHDLAIDEMYIRECAGQIIKTQPDTVLTEIFKNTPPPGSSLKTLTPC